ncbi:DUF1273 domain-containing protein [Bacillus badius]|uniref:UPF0398 protein SD77_2383 n=1 Tax=Bacillus badius TaxID=1455 RepID=A0ABR5AZ25_BACBA|nr:DUF1273 domain-containing protein [Bacillus badius]KIL79929.1 hypothetical protein SD77_2383 [Bacillus badius]MED4714999.1 DUF1273 domain-containing protein [Bacillus badius]
MSVWTVAGYKPYELGIFKQNDPAVFFIKKALEKELLRLLDEGMEWLLISGQLGVECWAAEVLFQLKEEVPHVKLAVLTPFAQQQENWKEETQHYYEAILAKADFVDSISKEPYKSPSQFRNKNQLFLRKAAGLLAIYDDEKPGSPQYLWDMARAFQEKHPFEIRQITFYDLQFITEEEQLKETDWD